MRGFPLYTREEFEAGEDYRESLYSPEGYLWVDPHRRNYSRQERPYGYSEHYLVGMRRDGDEAVYSDRLQQWDLVSFSRAWARTGSYTKSLRKASDFLTTYFNRPIEASAVAEGCNVSNGYPYWIVWFRDPATAHG